MQEVEAMCDRVIMISKGKLVADDLVTTLTQDGKSLEDTFRSLANSDNHVEHI
jgi:ABC-type Na+ transport system ATPase subunit NatA